jgi:pyruvate-formate lyase
VSQAYAAWRPCYLLSSLVDDCLDRGREQQDGGARHHDYGFAILGLTSAADALNAVRVAVFGEGFVSARELLEALRANYEGHEVLQARLRRLPRYGSGDAAADALMGRLLGDVCRQATSTRTRFGGFLKPMFFNFVWTPGASRELGARADGLRAGERIGHGMTPQQQAMTAGITAAMNSCLALDFTPVAGGATTMWDVDPHWASHDVMKALLQRFLDGGGMILQGNATPLEELEDALRHPESYPNLIVRVGGFSARFVTLSPDVQQEIVSRHRHRG